MAANILSLAGSPHDAGIPAVDISLISEPQPLSISGADLIRRGIGKGREIGAIISILQLCLCENPLLNDADTLLSISEELSGKIRRFSLL